MLEQRIENTTPALRQTYDARKYGLDSQKTCNKIIAKSTIGSGIIGAAFGALIGPAISDSMYMVAISATVGLICGGIRGKKEGHKEVQRRNDGRRSDYLNQQQRLDTRAREQGCPVAEMSYKDATIELVVRNEHFSRGHCYWFDLESEHIREACMVANGGMPAALHFTCLFTGSSSALISEQYADNITNNMVSLGTKLMQKDNTYRLFWKNAYDSIEVHLFSGYQGEELYLSVPEFGGVVTELLKIPEQSELELCLSAE